MPKAAMLVLAGAVTKGAFEAGALQILAERKIPIRRIVASSSGALNGVIYAAGVRARQEKAAAQTLATLWEHRGAWYNVMDVHLGDIVRGDGLSRQGKLRALLREAVAPAIVPDPATIDMDIIVAPLNGLTGHIGDHPATTYTKLMSFPGESFDREDRLEEVFTAALASAALPGLFVPVFIPGLGQCVDGGLVSEALTRGARTDSAAAIDVVFVVASTPAEVSPSRRAWRGGALWTHLMDMLFSERLYHHMHWFVQVNEALRALEEIAARRGLDDETLSELKDALDWEERRVIPIVPIQPREPLPGDLFSGFFSRSMRRRYLEIGVARAAEVLDSHGLGRAATP